MKTGFMKLSLREISWGMTILAVVMAGPSYAQAALPDADQFDVDVGGSFIEDYTYLQDIARKENPAAQWHNRRTNVGIEVEYDSRITLELDLGYNPEENSFTWRDAFLSFDLPKRLEVRVGKMKQDFGISRSSSLKNLLGPERPMAYDMLSLERGAGVEVEKGLETLWISGAFFKTDSGIQDMESVLGRILYESDHEDYWHAGASLATEDYNDGIYRVRTRAQTDVMNNFLSTEKIDADRVDYFGLDGVWQRGRLIIIGEYLDTRVASRKEGDREYTGGYIQGSWFLSDDRHEFRRGLLRRVDPANGHAVEMVGTYSRLDAFFEDKGFDAEIFSIGVNYYFMDSIKLMLEASRLEIKKGEYADEKGISGILRLQYEF